MNRFELKMLPWNVAFGAGEVRTLPERLDALGFGRALVLSTPEQADLAQRIAASLGHRSAGVFSDATMHVPAPIAARAASEAKALGADCSIAIGGGSTTGLGKRLALDPGIPLIAVPTTYAGSEMTPIWGMTTDGRKQTGRDPAVLPVLTIYDAELTLSLGLEMTGASAFNALAQAVVNAKDPRSNPLITTMALEAIGALAAALPTVMAEPTNVDARGRLLYGASLAGAALGTGVTSLHHKLCHTLGGSYNTPHADTHAILLPYTTAYDESAVPERMTRIAAALAADADTTAAQALYDLKQQLELPLALSAIGIGAGDVDNIVGIALENPPENPRAVDAASVSALLQQAIAGTRP